MKNYNLLKQLTEFHSVTGDTQLMIEFLKNYFTKNKTEFWQDGFGTLLVGNKNAKKLFASHIDEVGFQITKIEDNGKVRVLPVGWVFPNRLDHSVVYVNVNGQKVPGFIVHEEYFKSENIQSFNSLYLKIDSKEIKEGMMGSFQKSFSESENALIGTGIDNKASVWAILELITEDKTILKDNLFAFTTDEEMQDHSANGLCFKYKPDIAFVLDYIPTHIKLGLAENLGKNGEGSLVMYRGGHYIIHPEVREFFETKIKTKFQKGFLSSETLPSLEPNNFENNGHTKAVNIMLPAQGYHGSAYWVEKRDLEDFRELTCELITLNFS